VLDQNDIAIISQIVSQSTAQSVNEILKSQVIAPESREGYIYVQSFTAVPSGGRIPLTLQTQADGDFLCTSLAAEFDPNNPDWLLQITNQSTNKNFFFLPMPVRSICNYDIKPNFDLPVGYFIQASSQVTVDITNNNPAAQSITISLIGIKLLKALVNLS
jgi:hypothetical protein